MSITVEINPLNQDDKLLSVPEIAKLLKLEYGYSDNNYCLVKNKTGSFSILYDKYRVGRGFDVWYEKNDIFLRLPLPTTSHDIEMFYSSVEKLCMNMGVYFYKCNGKIMGINEVYSTVDLDIETSKMAIERIKEAIDSGLHNHMVIFGALSPVFIGEEEIYWMGEDLEGFDDVMHNIQTTDSLYCNPRFYDMGDKKLRGIYFIREGVRTTIPLKEDYPYQKIDNLDCYLVQLPDENYIPYKVFVDNVRYAEYYDAGHITVTLNGQDIAELVEKYAVDIITKKPVKGFYWGDLLDSGYSHSSKIQKLRLPVQEVNSVNHMAVFLRWAKENNILSSALLETCPQLLLDAPDYRKIIISHKSFRNMLRIGHFNEKGREFVKLYYRFNTGGFPAHIDEYTEKFFGSEKYNSEEFKDEAYLFMIYDESYYENLSAYIDREWKKFNK